ncbi:MAG: fumarylacetoacetate hydrolase family protein [Candidatus Riflebacteria bacterium]|nr:fumarylacetoacetate hydrolase family protein [Candidatus Riflebacteria bacterium]
MEIKQSRKIPPFTGTKILCVGRNYKPHVEELGNSIPKEPLWFSKPLSSIIGSGEKIILPEGFGRIDYEGEMALVISKKARNLSPNEALDFLEGVTVALDITARELQKQDGQWTRAKGFDTFCPLGPFVVPFEKSWLEAELTTELNGKTVQKDSLSSLIFSVPTLLAHITRVMTLEPGDVILTGTPAGIGPLKHGDVLKVKLSASSEIILENFVISEKQSPVA